MAHKKIVIHGGPLSYTNFFTRYGKVHSFLDDIDDKTDFIVFTGGADVNPHLYGEQRHITTSINKNRDNEDNEAWYMARELNIPCVGVCRGAQFLCVKNGGKLVQDVNNHHHSHMMIMTDEKEEILVTSSHHQMMLPHNGIILGYSTNIATKFINGNNENISKEMPTVLLGPIIKEPEEVYWKDTKSLGVQYHPEWYSDGTAKMRQRFDDLMERFIL